MSPVEGVGMVESTRRNRLVGILGEYAEDFDEAANCADDPASADAYAILAALARDESPPRAAAQRLLDRARGE